LTYVYLPRLRAALALHRQKPLEAIAALESALPYEMRDYTVPSLRGDAYLQAGQPSLAQVEYNKILANPGIDPTSVLRPLASLGLARALIAQENPQAASAAYRTFFDDWKNADPGLPLLKEARKEYAQLRLSNAGE